jgi:hypothetical protein
MTIKIIGEKYDILSPIACIFFQVSHNLMKHCSCSVILSLFFSFPLSFLSFSPFFVGACCFYDIFSPSGHIYFPPGGGGGGGLFSIYRPLTDDENDLSFIRKVEKNAVQNLFGKNRKSLFPQTTSFLGNILAK